MLLIATLFLGSCLCSQEVGNSHESVENLPWVEQVIFISHFMLATNFELVVSRSMYTIYHITVYVYTHIYVYAYISIYIELLRH